MAKDDRDLTRTYTRSQFVAKLRRLANALEIGRPFTIQVAGDRLRIPADAAFNIEHERSGQDSELEFQPLPGRPDLLRLSPLDFLQAISRLIPPPRVHRHRYHGVLASNARLRKRVGDQSATRRLGHSPAAFVVFTVVVGIRNPPCDTRHERDVGRCRSSCPSPGSVILSSGGGRWMAGRFGLGEGAGAGETM